MKTHFFSFVIIPDSCVNKKKTVVLQKEEIKNHNTQKALINTAQLPRFHGTVHKV